MSAMPAQLQSAFSTLQRELEAYIRSEVERQVKAQMGAKQSVSEPNPNRTNTSPYAPGQRKYNTPPPVQNKPVQTNTDRVPSQPVKMPASNVVNSPSVNQTPYQTAQRLLKQVSQRKNLSR